MPEPKTTLTRRSQTLMTIKLSFKESKITTRNLKGLSPLKKETSLRSENLCQDQTLTGKISKVRLPFLGISFQLLQLNLVTRELMLQISIKCLKKECRDLTQLRRSTMLPKIVCLENKLCKTILRKVTRSQLKNTKNPRT